MVSDKLATSEMKFWKKAEEIDLELELLVDEGEELEKYGEIDSGTTLTTASKNASGRRSTSGGLKLKLQVPS